MLSPRITAYEYLKEVFSLFNQYFLRQTIPEKVSHILKGFESIQIRTSKKKDSNQKRSVFINSLTRFSLELKK